MAGPTVLPNRTIIELAKTAAKEVVGDNSELFPKAVEKAAEFYRTLGLTGLAYRGLVETLREALKD